MRKEQVPEDMTSDMKNILGMISTRQLIYLIIGGSLLYIYIPIVFGFLNGIVASFIICLISAIPTLALTGLLGFVKHPKYQVYFDKYFLIMLQKRSQKGNWRRT